MKYIFFSIGLFLFAPPILFMGGDVAWLILVCSLVGAVLCSSLPSTLRGAVALAGVGLLAAHCCGYKIYGKPILHDNRPVLPAPLELASITPPNFVNAMDGTRLEVYGIAFTPGLLALPASELQILLSDDNGPVLIQPDDGSPSGVVVQRRCGYGCGNTFFTTFAPRRLPKYRKTDMGRFLINWNYATADHPN